MMNCGNCIYGQETAHKECENCIGSNFVSKDTLVIDAYKRKIMNEIIDVERVLKSYIYREMSTEEMEIVKRMASKIEELKFKVSCMR